MSSPIEAVDEPAVDETHESGYGSRAYMNYVLFLLFLVFFVQQLDRGIIQVLIEPIKGELKINDSMIGFLVGPAFAVIFAVGGIPLGLLADRWSRKRLLLMCLTFWSTLTTVCGFAGSYGQLVVARMGVGIGEAGGAPCAVSMIADIFPPQRRASAMSFFYVGGAASMMAIFFGGAALAAAYGWRVAFIVAGGLGVVVALVILLSLKEPQRGASEGILKVERVSVTETFRFIAGQRSIVHSMTGMVMFQVTGTAIMSFIASFLMRSHGFTLMQVGMFVALGYGIGNLIGLLSGGFMADMLARRNVRWRTRMGLISAVGAGGFLVLLLAVDTTRLLAVAFFGWSFSCGLFAAPTYGLFQSLVKSNMRATISSIQSVAGYAIGGSIGPVIVGIASDMFAARYGQDSMRHALMLMSPFYAWAALHYLLAERSLAADLKQARG